MVAGYKISSTPTNVPRVANEIQVHMLKLKLILINS